MDTTGHVEFAVEDCEDSEDIAYTDDEEEGSLMGDERPATPIVGGEPAQAEFHYVDVSGEDMIVSRVNPSAKVELIEKPVANSDYFLVKDADDNVYRAYRTDARKCIVLATPDDDQKAVSAMSKQIQFTERLARVSLDHIQKMLEHKECVPVVSKLWNLHFGKGMLLSSALANRVLTECRQKRKEKAAKRKATVPVSAGASNKRKTTDTVGAGSAKKRKPAAAHDHLAVIKEETGVLPLDAKVSTRPQPTARTMQVTLSGVCVADVLKIAALFPEM